MPPHCPGDDADRGPDGASSLERLLAAWQASGEHPRFEALLAAVKPVVERIASRTLSRHRVADPAAVDDAVSRVFDHLRRLPGTSAGERLVARFVPPAGDADGCRGDRGEAYVAWLARERAIDVVRSRSRIRRRAVCFSELSVAATTSLAARDEKADDVSPPSASGHDLHDAIRLLDGRQRIVIDLLISGKSQAAIARELDVCAGTVSRLRARAIAAIRRLLAE